MSFRILHIRVAEKLTTESKKICLPSSRRRGLFKLSTSLAMTLFLLLFLACQQPKTPPPTGRGPETGLSEAIRSQLEHPFVIVRDGDIYLVDAFARETRLTQTAIEKGAYIKDPALSQDGKKIVYAYTPPVRGSVIGLSGSELWTINLDGSDQRMLSRDSDPGGRFDQPAWSPDGASLYYSYYRPIYSNGKFVDTELSIERLDLSTMARTTIENNAYYPSVSKDGKNIALIRVGTNGVSQSLITKGLNNQTATVLTKEDNFLAIAEPRISPKGDQIAFIASGEYRPTALQNVDKVKKGNTFRLPKLWSVAEANGLPWDVWTINLDGTGLTKITELFEDSPSIDWSSDGRYIAILGIKGLFLADVNEKKVASIGSKGAFHGNIDWGF
ncbi:MAG: hypothetical protein EXR50_01180 [Dehalococcoidia bacterium]|nr:hypothetical protein [Dehalococcoidia bacterium]